LAVKGILPPAAAARAAWPSAAACALAAALAVAALAPAAWAERFEIAAGAAENVARFRSHAAVESFEGKTRQVSGWVECDPAALGDSVTVYVAVDLASLDTGIDLRNRHMRENHLETDKYPQAVFRGGRLFGAPAKLEVGQSATFEIAGEIELHGVTRPLRAPLEVTLLAADGPRQLRVATHFPVSLADFHIARPQFLIVRLAETQQVSLEATAVAPAAPAASKGDKP
jgi:polyisoprenoid-binding protein YceI